MKTIILVRHATAVDKNLGIPDFERTLTVAGVAEAKRAARVLARACSTPGLLVSSPADRALETAHLCAEALGYEVQRIHLASPLYDEGTQKGVLAVLRHLSSAVQTVVLFGHNPSFEEAARLLAPNFLRRLPKAGIVIIAVQIKSWRNLRPGVGTMTDFWSPKARGRWKLVEVTPLAPPFESPQRRATVWRRTNAAKEST